MKANVRTWSLLALLLAILAFIIFRYCRNGGDEGKDSGGSIVWTDPIKSPVAIAFIDANRLLNTQIPNVKVTLIDPGGMVVTSNGLSFTSIDVPGGVMCLGLKANAPVSAQNPYRFTIKAEADGYSTNLRNILVTSEEGQYAPVFMSKLEEPPPGMATFWGTSALNGGVLNDGLILFSPNKSSGVTGNIRVEIPKDALPLYCRDKPGSQAPKNLNYRISYASPQSLEGGRTFPGGALVTDAFYANGGIAAEPKAPIYFATAGWINIEVDADGEQLSGFNKPTTVTMPIPDNLENPFAQPPQKYYKKDDKIDVWSLNDQGVWRQESVATVKQDAATGNLYAVMEVTHFSTWNLDVTPTMCPGLVDISYNYDPAGTQAPTPLFTELIPQTNGVPLSYTTLDYEDNDGGASKTHKIMNAPRFSTVAFVVYNNSAGPTAGGQIVGSSPFFTNCANPPTFTIQNPNTTRINLSFKVDIINGTTPAGNPKPICKNAVWFHACSGSCSAQSCSTDVTTAFLFGGFLKVQPPPNNKQGTVTISAALPGGGAARHCIRLWYAGENSGTSVSQQVDFMVDFGDKSSTATSITGRIGTTQITILRAYNDKGTPSDTDDVFEFTLPQKTPTVEGLTQLTACN